MTDRTVLYVWLDTGDVIVSNKIKFKQFKGLAGAAALSGIGDDAFQKPGSVWVLKGEKMFIISPTLNWYDPQPPGPFDAKLPVLAKAAAALL